MTPNNFETTTDSIEQTNRNILLSTYIKKIYDLINKIVSIWDRDAEDMNDEDSEYEPEFLCRFELIIGDNIDIYNLNHIKDEVYNIYDIDDLKTKICFIITKQQTTGEYLNIPIYLNSFNMYNICKKVCVLCNNERLNP